MTWGQVIWWAASSIVSWAMQPKPKSTSITQEGSRLSDLKVQSSSLGQTIPRVWGTMRIAGNMIWSLPIKETAHVDSQTQEAGGKGGGGGASQTVTTTTYTYSQTFAIAICEGPISGIRKIWANGELIYTAGADSDIASLIASGGIAQGIAFHLGESDQLPDIIIQAYDGVANTQAYRDTVYVVFDDLQLEKYGNRTPNLEFEVVSLGGNEVLCVPGNAMPTLYGLGWGKPAWNGAFLCRAALGYTRQSAISYDGSTWTVGPRHTLTDNEYLGEVTYGNGIFVATCTRYHAMTCISTDGLHWAQGSVSAYYRIDQIAFGAGVFIGIGDADIYNNVGIYQSFDGVLWTSAVSLDGYATDGDIIWCGSFFCAVFRVGTTLVSYTSPTGLPGTWAKGGGGTIVGITIGWNGQYVLGIDAGEGKCAKSEDGLTWSAFESPATSHYGRPIWVGDKWHMIDADYCTSSADGETWTSRPLSDSAEYMLDAFGIGGVILAYSADASYFIQPYGVVPGSVSLAQVVTDIVTESSPLTSFDIDVIDLSAESVTGYAITQRQSGRESLEPLMSMYFFDVVESAAKLKFVRRGGAVAVVIPEDDLAAHTAGSDMPDQLEMTRQQEVELPREVSVQYLSSEASYQTGVQYGRRILTTSQMAHDVSFMASMTDTKAKQIADVMCHQPWVARNKFKFATSLKYACLEPTDVIQVVKGDATYTIRITGRSEANGILAWEGESEDASIYTQSGTASATPAPPTTISVPGPTYLALLDIPLLRDNDNSYGFYAAARGYLPGWHGAQLYKAPDNTTWSQFGNALLNGATMGTAVSALGTFSGGNLFDEANTLSVLLIGGALSSLTEAQVLNGGNACIIGSELLYFKNAVLTDTNTYTLSGFLRGRRGTEWAMSTHVAAERFVLLTANTVYNQPESSSEIGISRWYKAPAFGSALINAVSAAFTDTSVRLECLSPVGIGGGRDSSGNLTINWIRRGRTDIEWRDYVDVPVGETAESYEIDIMSGATVKRTITATTNTASYTAAQQTTDFGSPQSSIPVNIYQMSAAVGRGYVGVATI
jgi:hypothetical protein